MQLHQVAVVREQTALEALEVMVVQAAVGQVMVVAVLAEQEILHPPHQAKAMPEVLVQALVLEVFMAVQVAVEQLLLVQMEHQVLVEMVVLVQRILYALVLR
tara:strand:+ start:209 stop:514 length:306 start_codon:yes stop_codon:yes gene_type:complete